MSGRVGRTIAMVGVALWLASAGQAWASARVALVLGNGDYGPEIGKLKNPSNDAKLVADTLKGLGFDVALVTDADQKAMKRAIREFGQRLRETGPEGIGFFYYAGHGVQVDGENYLLPIGAEIQAEGDVELEAVSATSILSQMQFAGNAVNLVFLDACRNNPLTRSFRSQTRGLARVDAPRGSFVGYSTAPGDVSVDGDSDHSPYALALVEELKQPGISIEEAHRAVRGKVLAATNQRQTPWDSSSLTGPVILAEPVALVTPATPAETPDGSTSGGSSGGSANANQQAELLFWDSIKSSDNPATFEAYLKQFPNGIFAGLAQAKLDELKSRSDNRATTPEQQAAAKVEAETAAWSGIKDSDDPAMYQAFLKQFPDGNFAGLAQAKLDALKAKAVTAEAQSAARQLQPPPEPEAAPDGIEDMSGTFVAIKSANVRATPTADAKVVAKLSADQAVDATGRTTGGEWLRVAVKGKTGFVSAKLMAAADPDEVAAWSVLKGAPSPAAAKTFIAEYPNSYFRSKADALLVTLQAADAKKSQQAMQTADAVEPAAPAPAAPAVATAPTAPSPTQQAAATPPPGTSIIRISGELREEIERFIGNSRSFSGTHRFLALNAAGDKIGVGQCNKTGYWDGCGGLNDMRAGAKKMALSKCGAGCRIIYEGVDKVGTFEIEWY